MGKITDIKPQARNKGRVSIFVDDTFFCGMEKLTAMAYRLKIGDDIDADKLAAAVHESECTSAFERAGKYLGLRPRTAWEMRRYLGEKGYGEDIVEQTIEKLMSYHYIDDAEYCRIYVETYRHKSGARKLEAELYQKGVGAELVTAAIEAMGEQTDEVVRLAEKYLRSHERDMHKLTAYLMSKGFEYDVIKDAIRLLEEGE